MAGYVPTDLSTRFGRSFHGNRRGVRRVLAILVVLGLVPAVVSTTLTTSGAQTLVPPLPPIAEGCQPDPGSPLTPDSMRVERDTDAANVELNETVLVSPTVFQTRRRLEPGDAFTCVLTIRSRRAEPATVQLEPFGVIGSRAPNSQFEYVDATDDRWDQTAGDWIDPLVDEVVVPPRGVVRVPFQVTVPDEPPPAGAYGSINVVSRTRASAGAANLGIETHVASMLLLALPGEGSADLRLRSVDAPKLRWDRESWPLAANVDNDGELHARVDGRVRIRSMFGNEVASLPIEQRTILPGGRTEVDIEWDQVPWLGVYRYDVRVSGGEPESVATHEGWFVALPPWWVLAITAAVVLVLVVRRFLRREDDETFDDEFADDDPP